jgi:hypothetical protein
MLLCHGYNVHFVAHYNDAKATSCRMWGWGRSGRIGRGWRARYDFSRFFIASWRRDARDARGWSGRFGDLAWGFRFGVSLAEEVYTAMANLAEH